MSLSTIDVMMLILLYTVEWEVGGGEVVVIYISHGKIPCSPHSKSIQEEKRKVFFFFAIHSSFNKKMFSSCD